MAGTLSTFHVRTSPYHSPQRCAPLGSHFTEEEIEVQRGEGICPQSQSKYVADLNPGSYHCRVCAHLAPPGTGEHIGMPVSSRSLSSCCFLSLQPDCQRGEGRPAVLLLFCNPRSRAHPADLPLLARTSLPSGCLLVHLFCPRLVWSQLGLQRLRKAKKVSQDLSARLLGSGPPLAASPGLFLMC